MSDKIIKRILVLTGYAAAVIFSLAPFCYMLGVSFTDTHAAFGGGGVKFTVENYKAVIPGGSISFTRCLYNSLVISFFSSLLTVVLASLTAYAVAKIDFNGKTALMAGVLGLSLFPQISVAGYIFKLLSSAGLINTHIGLILPYTAWAVPLCLWILVSYFMTIPKDLDKAAQVDGAGPLQVIYHVILPAAMPGIVTAFLITFIFTLNEFLFALMFTIDEGARTVPVAVALFTGSHGQTPWGEIMAAAAVTAVPVVLIAAAAQKQIIQGLTKGSVK